MTGILPIENEGGTEKPTVAGIRFAAYDRAANRHLQMVFEAKRRAEPVLGQIELVERDHAGPIRSVGGEKPFDSPMKVHSGAASIGVADIENRDFEAYARMINTMSDELLAGFAETFFGGMGAITAHVGNVVDGAEKTLFEQFKEGIMKVALDFDDNGNLIPQQLIVHPDKKHEARLAMEQVMNDAEVQAHVLVERKKFLDSRPRRRLLSPC